MSIAEIAVAAVFIVSYSYLPITVAVWVVILTYALFLAVYGKTVKGIAMILKQLIGAQSHHPKHQTTHD